MIKISTRVLYGLRAIIYIVLNRDRWPISLNEVAKRQNIPLRYVEQIFIKLRKANIVKSVRGIKGGYVLRDNYEEISLLDIVEVCDNRIVPVWCLNLESKKKCPIVENCFLSKIFCEMGEVVKNYLSNIKLKDIVAEAEKTGFLDLMGSEESFGGA